MTWRMQTRRAGWAAAVAAVVLAAAIAGCGEKEIPHNTNLLVNGSFEEVGRDGIPKGWHLTTFRGIPGEPEIQYGIDEETATDGKKSWRFKADPSTRFFHMLAQEVDVRGATRVRLRGSIQLDQVRLQPDQFPICNYFLIFYDENHNRFQANRPADQRTRPRNGTALWLDEDEVFRLPAGTRYVGVACALGADGTAWFDNVSLEVPAPPAWQQSTTPNYVFHWFPERAFPEGAMETQQRIFDRVCQRLEITSDVVVDYYLYPDSSALRETLGVNHDPWVSWKDREIHTTHPLDGHEVVHFILYPYGTPPRFIVEGIAYWLGDKYAGYPIHSLAAYWLARDKLPTLKELADRVNLWRVESVRVVPACASFVGFILEQYGTQRLLELFRQANGIDNYSRLSLTFKAVYGVSLEQVDENWRNFLAQSPTAQIAKEPTDQPGMERAMEHGDQQKGKDQR